MITLYSTNCPKCKVLEQKLKQKNIEYSTVTDMDEIVEYGRKHNLKSAPILEVDNEPYDFMQALEYIKNIG